MSLYPKYDAEPEPEPVANPCPLCRKEPVRSYGSQCESCWLKHHSASLARRGPDSARRPSDHGLAPRGRYQRRDDRADD